MQTEPERLRRIHEILLAALDHTTQERPEFLDEVCGEDVLLRRRVESLLAGENDMVADELCSVPLGPTADPALAEGDRIDAYQVIQKLGQGGMGVVYLAKRIDGELDHRVAIKVLRPGLATSELVRRFRVERQILANLDHPGIARLLGGGSTEQGHPYLMMEYVDGEPLDEYCREHQLTVRQRLELFRKVCSAVELAHRNLVVHRDLKPSNILVTASGEPKLLDFGIAKLLDASSLEPLSMTDANVRPMTPGYASPEQVRGEPITTASDVYSLGVLLYELLTGQPPYRFKTGRLEDVYRVVCEEEPERPSTAVGRGADPPYESSRRRLRGDLDDIVLKALRKEPEHRYGSVEQFSDDLGRHLDGHPVRARKGTFTYRAGKFLRRHRAKVFAAVAAVIVLAVIAVDRERQRADVVRERDRAERITAFLVDLFAISDPGTARANSLTVREVLDRGASEIQDGLEDDPELRAALMSTMGQVYMGLGLYDSAEPLLEQALMIRRDQLAEAHPAVAESLMEMANLHRHREAFAEAELLLRQALEIQLELLGRDHPRVAASIQNLGTLRIEQDDFDTAEKLLNEALELRRRHLPPDHPHLLSTLNNLVVLLIRKGDLDKAEPLASEVLELRRQHYEEDHPAVLMDLSNLANLHARKGDYTTMRDLSEDGLRLCRQRYGARHPKIAAALDNLGFALAALGDHEQAEPHFAEALEQKREILGAEHPATARTMVWLAAVQVAEAKYATAEPLAREALRIFQAKTPDHWRVAEAQSVLGGCLSGLGQEAEAERLLHEGHRKLVELKGDDHLSTRRAKERILNFQEAHNTTLDMPRPLDTAAAQN